MPTTGELFAYGIALLTLILNFTGRNRDSKQDAEARGMWQGTVNQQLKTISETATETARKVGELAAIPAKIDGMEKRIGNLENKLDRHCQDERGDTK